MVVPPLLPPPENLPWARNSKPNVLSLFDGIAIGRQALLELGFQELGGYHAFEVSQNAMAVANSNHKDITQHGDVREVCLSACLHAALHMPMPWHGCRFQRQNCVPSSSSQAL